MTNRMAGRGFIDGMTRCLMWMVFLTTTAVFCWIVGDVVWKGIDGISWRYLVQPIADGGRAGGMAPILVSSLLILVVCLATAVPIGVCTAALLAEFTRRRHWFGIFVRRSLDVLAGVPSIVFGLFGNALFCVWLGMGYSILAGGLTLACMVLPIFIRSVEEGFGAVPDEIRFAAAALGLSQSRTFFRVLLPSAIPGLVVGLVLGIGRALAETAALLFTSGMVDRMPTSFWDSGRSLAVHIYTLGMDVPGGEVNAYTSALVLVVLLLAINITASVLSPRYG